VDRTLLAYGQDASAVWTGMANGGISRRCPQGKAVGSRNEFCLDMGKLRFVHVLAIENTHVEDVFRAIQTFAPL